MILWFYKWGSLARTGQDFLRTHWELPVSHNLDVRSRPMGRGERGRVQSSNLFNPFYWKLLFFTENYCPFYWNFWEKKSLSVWNRTEITFLSASPNCMIFSPFQTWVCTDKFIHDSNKMSSFKPMILYHWMLHRIKSLCSAGVCPQQLQVVALVLICDSTVSQVKITKIFMIQYKNFQTS